MKKRAIVMMMFFCGAVMSVYFSGFLESTSIININNNQENILQAVQQKQPEENFIRRANDEIGDLQPEIKKFEDPLVILNNSEFSDDFNIKYTLEETGNMDESKDKNWWVNSGAFLFSNNGTGKTIIGELEKGEKWQEEYRDYNSSETDNGYHPQNIFRLITRSKWKNFQQECYYKINHYITSKAKERSESNGILLFNRYQDGDNLYYAGLRVDGTVVIKKKIKGEYYLMAQKAFYPGVYNRKKNPNLIPLNKWIGIKSEVRDNADGSVSIKLYVDNNRSSNWKLALTAVDKGRGFGGKVIKNAGYAGIRTDFMDVEFDDYKIEEIKIN